MLFSCCTNFLPCDNKSLPYFCVDFYLRPPRGGQPLHRGGESRNGGISIHALREEGDRTRPTRASSGWNFYPRPPRGGRHQIPLEQWYQTNFYPRPPRGGRRWVRYTPASSALIFIHALREEGDCTAQMIDPELVQFLSTPSARRATAAYLLRLAESRYFYPRPPRGGRPCCSGQAPTLHADFYPRPPRGGRP